ncbi:MAG TPA: cell division protein FtsZ [Desulfomicrobiaceae bacterium]|nr:cell division protein FtsZ [Desulfomicrobiaceae bacterium]
MDFLELEREESALIKVVGVGGGGGNAVNNMITSSMKGVTFITANTDMQALKHSKAEYKIQLGEKLTKGLGAGANPETGRDAAQESMGLIKETLGECDMVFITAGMGGGTGTGAAPVIAQAAKEMGALTVAVVTKPFYFEGQRRLKQAEKGIKALREVVDSIITIPNDRLLALASKKATFIDMLSKADEVLFYAVKGISDLIMVPGLINLDFADVKAVMSEMGLAMMGTGISQGEGRAREAAMKAITSPLLEDVSIDGAKGVLMNISCGPDLTIDEVSEAANIIHEAAHDDAKIYFGTVFDSEISDEMRITVIATGIGELERASHDDNVDNVTSIAPTLQNRPAPKSAVDRPRERKISPNEAQDLNVPAYLRRTKVTPPVEESSVKPASGGEEEFVFDEEDFEIPSFIRMQAD